jgi:predicted MFS family arabinose efflux permease
VVLMAWVRWRVPDVPGTARNARVPLARVASLPTLGLWAGSASVLLTRVALWAPLAAGHQTLIQTALVDASGPANADGATSLQTTVYNAGTAGGSPAGGLVLEGMGAGALPWTAFPLVAVALLMVALGRRRAFPPARHAETVTVSRGTTDGTVATARSAVTGACPGRENLR